MSECVYCVANTDRRKPAPASVSGATMRIYPDSKLLHSQPASDGEQSAAQLEGRRKQRRYGYLAWLCLGSHYLYLGRPATQALFWLTAGGLLLWWFADLFRMPRLVERQNRRATAKLLASLRKAAERHRASESASILWPAPARSQSEEIDRPSAFHEYEAQSDAFEQASVRAEPTKDPRRIPGMILVVTVLTTGAMAVFSPPPLRSRAALEPTFRTMRPVNVREAPSTTSAVRAVIGKDLIVRGRIETVGSTRWLWITRGSHPDSYVALANLEQR